MSDPEQVIVGKITKGHGVRGAVVVALRTDQPELRFAKENQLVTDDGRFLKVKSVTKISNRFVVSFESITTRDQADGLVGQKLWCQIDLDEPLAEEEFHDRQLIGLNVLDHCCNQVGKVVAISHIGPQDLLEFQTGSEIRLVPFVKALVPVVDLAGGYLQLADIPGLLSDQEDQ